MEAEMKEQIAMLKERVELLECEITIRWKPQGRYDEVIDHCDIIKSIADDINDLRVEMDLSEGVPPPKIPTKPRPSN